jgi:hypothetical protein
MVASPSELHATTPAEAAAMALSVEVYKAEPATFLVDPSANEAMTCKARVSPSSQVIVDGNTLRETGGVAPTLTGPERSQKPGLF